METKIKNLCRSHLGWKANDEQILLQELGAGCSNTILTASLMDTQGNVVDKVLVRNYGTNIAGRLVEDVYTTCYLATLGHVPRVRALYPGGRLEEFLPSKMLTYSEFRERYSELMRIMSRVHSLELPLNKNPCIEKLLRDHLGMLKDSTDRRHWEHEVDWFLETLNLLSRDLTVTFCHNDFNMNNILVPTNSGSGSNGISNGSSNSSSLVLIDYEYSGYNYSLYDLANYCCELQYDWSYPQPPLFLHSSHSFPDPDFLLQLVKCYRDNSTCTELPAPRVMVKQVRFLALASEMLWAIWALGYDGSNLDMKEYYEAKSSEYRKKKQDFNDDIEWLLDYSKR